MDTVFEHRYVDVDDVAVDQRTIVGDAVADDLVDRRADGLLIAAVPNTAGIPSTTDVALVGDDVELFRGDTRFDVRASLSQDFRGERRCAPHALDELWRLDDGVVGLQRPAAIRNIVWCWNAGGNWATSAHGSWIDGAFPRCGGRHLSMATLELLARPAPTRIV